MRVVNGFLSVQLKLSNYIFLQLNYVMHCLWFCKFCVLGRNKLLMID